MPAAPPGLARRDGARVASAVILGNDAVLAARPHTAAQLANACSAAGFDVVVPPTWGDELTAQAYLGALARHDERIVAACACPRVVALVDAIGPATTSVPRAVVVPPPVAAARYLRRTHASALHVTYVGDCPGGNDPSIDSWLTPRAFFARLDRAGIDLGSQSTDMSGFAPQEWSRHAAMPGGLPALRFLARQPVSRVMRVIDARALESGAMLAGRSNVLADLADAAHCACGSNRDAIEEFEPPRSAVPIVRPAAAPDLASEPEPRAAATRVPERVAHTADTSARTDRLATVLDAGLGHTPVLQGSRAPEEAGRLGNAGSLANAGDLAHTRDLAPTAANATPTTVASVPGYVTSSPSGGPTPNATRASVDGARPRRVVALAALPVLVLAAVAALGAAVYGAAARHGVARNAVPGGHAPGAPGERTANGESGTSPAPRPAIVAADSFSFADTLATERRQPRSRDPFRSGVSRAGDSVNAPASDSAPPRRPARRSPRYRVVPGWLPQGQGAWSPADTIRLRTPDTLGRPARPDTGGPPA